MKILLTSAGRRGYLVRYFKEAIPNGEIHVANSSEYSAAIQFADRFVVAPLIHDESYIPFLLSYCLEQEITAIIPLFDIDLPILSSNKKQFEQIGVTVIVSDEKVIDVCNDKWETYHFLQRNGFKHPHTFLSVSSALNAIDAGKISFPLVVKPRWGMGSILIFEAEDRMELEIFYNKIKREIMKTYLIYDSMKNRNESVIIQEKVYGQEYGLDIINNLDGNYETTIVKKKIAMRAGETDYAVTVMDEELVQMGEHLSRKLGHIGNLDVDIFHCKNGDAYILEMNARFGGGYPFSHLAGANLPKAMVAWLQGDRVSKNELLVTPGVVGYKDINIIARTKVLMT
ncbi:carbamoyl-phosphate synthase large subunit [Cytobacillus eiseniae]|uniref:Carbamoyl-phosphate synthase large subunit n=1 Tax=Cytobacillus eiseniae TaxID=762947 RepID=A0ABS4RG41_9BACI|nr:ATP-grasp domain-containing protein [Cytobacillus eiseniae]MBP2241861.1 carbamoyl-phosphate synthase large subunit [Cytobacillus eiseniae]